MTLLGSKTCSRCTVSYRIEVESENSEAYRCHCGLRFWTYDEGDFAVMATANDNKPDDEEYGG